MKLHWWTWHHWEKWKDVEWGALQSDGVKVGTYIIQERICLMCGLKQLRRVGSQS